MKKTLKAASKAAEPRTDLKTLSIDVGGSSVKAALADPHGRLLTRVVREKTPKNCAPAAMLRLLEGIARRVPGYDRVSVGFPGIVREGKIVNAPNLSDRAWKNFPLAARLQSRLRRPVRVLNDADVQGLAAIRGKGIELLVTLGTGVGTSLFQDGRLLPHLELGMAHHPVEKGKTYNEWAGNHVRREIGDERWSRRVKKMVRTLREITHCDRIYFGGGNARRLRFRLSDDMKLVPNKAGIKGGAALWRG